MPSDPPIAPPNEATAAPQPPVEAADAVAPAPVEAAEAVAPAPAPVVPPAPVSPVKEWAVAVAIMIVFAIICAQFIGFLRSNQYGGP